MRHLFYTCIFLVAISACNSEKTKQAETVKHLINPVKDCQPGEDTFNFVTTFIKDTATTPTDRFYAIVSFISGKGYFKPGVNQTGKLKVTRKTAKIFPVAYDTCDMKRWIKKNFRMENIKVTKLDFTGARNDKYTSFTPRLHFEEWKFANNTDRDSAIKIVQTAYTYPNNIVMYEKRYSQFILDDRRIYLLETGAKFGEPYAIEYKNLIEQFIKSKGR
jgi:hypothetical protein